MQARASAGLTDGGPPARLLVVDDDDAVRDATVALLRGFGHTVVAADSGQAALDLLEHDRDFDLLIVDLAMPQMHGAAFARRARSLVPNVPTLFVTGYAGMHWLGEISKDHLLKKAVPPRRPRREAARGAGERRLGDDGPQPAGARCSRTAPSSAPIGRTTSSSTPASRQAANSVRSRSTRPSAAAALGRSGSRPCSSSDFR